VPSSSTAPSVQNNAGGGAPAAAAAPGRRLTAAERTQVIQAAKEALAANGDPTVIRQKLESVGIPPASVPGL
jgi:hypothetical protein